MNQLQLSLHKLKHWEYWPFGVVYLPMFFLWAYYSLRARSFFFFNAANPSILNGGFLMESKKAIYDILPQGLYPRAMLVGHQEASSKVKQRLSESGFSYPFIAKPDIGGKGVGVEKIHTELALEKYLHFIQEDFLIQEFVPLKNEVGIFYVRFPEEERGRITGVVAKEFLTVTGDGQSTAESLINQNPRFAMQIKALRKMHGNKLQNILPKGEQWNLVPYGNHARGAKFIDVSEWATPKLNETMNHICDQIPGFYFGRLDVMYNTREELENGINLSIIELNGAGSEPTHIYDPRHSLFFAWKEIALHLHYLFKISVHNHRKGHRYLSFKEGIEMLRQNNQHLNNLRDF